MPVLEPGCKRSIRSGLSGSTAPCARGCRRPRWRRRASSAGRWPARAEEPGARGSASRRARSAGWPGATVPRPSVLAPSASAGVSDCSGCQGSRSSALRCTAAAIASHGSSGETGASLPRASSTPSSYSQRSAKHRSVRSGQKLSVRSRSSSRCAGCTLARTPSRAIARESSRPISWACSIDPRAPVASNSLSACSTAASPIAWMATSRRCRLAASITLRRPSLVMFGAPVPPPRAYSEAHHAVRVFSDPSEMIFSGPIVTSGPHPGSDAPVGTPARRKSSSVSTYAPTRTRSSSAPAASRSGQSRTPWSNSRSTRPVTPFAAACCMVCR